jgi:hypothetical protein
MKETLQLLDFHSYLVSPRINDFYTRVMDCEILRRIREDHHLTFVQHEESCLWECRSLRNDNLRSGWHHHPGDALFVMIGYRRAAHMVSSLSRETYPVSNE